MNAKLQSEMRTRIKQLGSISTAPAILMPLLEMLRLPSEKIRIESVVELISYDGSIAGQCLRLANSPLFGRRQTETVRAAVMALGLERVRSLLLGLYLNRAIPQDKWVIEQDAFWRHSLGCALVAQRMAQKIEYPEPEKAYLAGLLHDLGLLVNSVVCNQEFRECLRAAAARRLPLHVIEEQVLGFTHADTGQILCEHWGLSQELGEVAGYHHNAELLPEAGTLACIVHLSDLLCRVRYLGYGYEEAIGVELSGDLAWQAIERSYPALEKMDLVRFTIDIDGAMDQIVTIVDSVFGVKNISALAKT
jgi:HD-like signal output (HDOD) protein